MLRSEAGRSNPDIERAIKELLAEDANFDRNENRSAHREYVSPNKLSMRFLAIFLSLESASSRTRTSPLAQSPFWESNA